MTGEVCDSPRYWYLIRLTKVCCHLLFLFKYVVLKLHRFRNMDSNYMYIAKVIENKPDCLPRTCSDSL